MSGQYASLPTTEKPAPAGFSLHPAFYIINWMFFSNMTIVFNKWLIDSAGFRYPVILTCWHLTFAAAATHILARTTTLLSSRHRVKMTGRIYLRAVLPIGVLYSGSLVCSNLVYLYLSVSFIQMLKAGAPIAVLFVSWLWGVARPTQGNVVNVLVIAVGVALASFGEINFSLLGFGFQVGGIVFEAMRLVMIQILLSGDDMKMDPLVSLYYYAPVCAAMNFIVAVFTELPTFKVADMWEAGVWMLLLNAIVAFMLNVASVFLIGKTSSLVLTLAGILKAIILVAGSVLLGQASTTLLQFAGYSVALAGLVYYSLGWDQIKALGSSAGAWASENLDDTKLSAMSRRILTAVLVVLIVVMLAVGLTRNNGVGGAGAVETPDSGRGFPWSASLGWAS